MRTRRSDSSDIYININDLIIELMKTAQDCSSTTEKAAIEKIISKLVSTRDSSQKK